MSPLALLALASATFLGTHFLLSHPLRAPLISRIGEGGFLGLYSLIAFATLGWMIVAAGQVGPQPLLWDAGPVGFAIGTLLTWIATILLVGSFRGNPALPTGGGKPDVPDRPHGVFTITRHPMMWGFGLWAVTHAIVNPTPSGLIIAVSIFVLAIVGAALQDGKKRKRLGDAWAAWQSNTSFLPFAGRPQWPGAFAVVAGTLLFLAATWARGALGQRPAGPWAFLV